VIQVLFNKSPDEVLKHRDLFFGSLVDRLSASEDEVEFDLGLGLGLGLGLE